MDLELVKKVRKAGNNQVEKLVELLEFVERLLLGQV